MTRISLKTTVLQVLFLLFPTCLGAQDLQGIMTIVGIREEEELTEQLTERFESLERAPIDINLSSMQRLVSSGLFTQYQAASLLDYRSTYGDILSIEELSAVDGFGKTYAEALRPYISLYSKSLPGQLGRQQLVGTATLRTTLKGQRDGSSVNNSFAVKGKLTLDYGTRASAALTGSWTGGNNYGYSFHGTVYGRKCLDRLVVGDFNARFGQGLAVWSGFSLSGMGAPSSLYRRATGITSSASYSGTGLRGVAMAASWGRLVLSAFGGFTGIWPGDWAHSSSGKKLTMTPGLNLSYFLKHGQISLTGLSSFSAVLKDGDGSKSMTHEVLKIGADARFCIKGIDLFGETGVDLQTMCVAGVGGLTFPIGDNSRAGLVARYYPQNYSKTLTGSVKSGTYARDEAGATVSFERKGFVSSADFYRKLSTGRDQVKFLASHEIALSENWSVKPRFSARLRMEKDSDPVEQDSSKAIELKTDTRTDISWSRVPWSQTVRVNWSHYRSDGFLGYYELGALSDVLTGYLRLTGFWIDNWDDRIYVYERDGPGNFNVPAYYGRGYAVSLTGSWKPKLRKGRLKLYSSLYHKNAKKPGDVSSRTSGLRFQAVFDF